MGIFLTISYCCPICRDLDPSSLAESLKQCCGLLHVVQAYLNGIDVPGIFLMKTLVVKLLGSVGAVAGGLAVGKEGPFVHAGACLGALLSQVWSLAGVV